MKKNWKAVLVAALGAIAAYFLPKPAPGPTPTPTPTVSPSAAPEPASTPVEPSKPTPTPPAADCFTPRGVCVEKNGGDFPYKAELTEAQDKAEETFLVDGVISSEEGYMDEVLRLMRLKGVCVQKVQFDEVGILSGPGLSYNVDILAGEPNFRVPFQKLAGQCRPAIVG